MKEVKLTDKDLLAIKSASIDKYISGGIGETGLVKAVIDGFIGYCNSKGYLIKDGKVFINDRKSQS